MNCSHQDIVTYVNGNSQCADCGVNPNQIERKFVQTELERFKSALLRISNAPTWPAKTVSGGNVRHTYADYTVDIAKEALAPAIKPEGESNG